MENNDDDYIYEKEFDETGLDFSDKYQPLFELLTCRQELSELQTYIIGIGDENITQDITNRLEYLIVLSRVDTVLISGGRDSGKTFAFGCWTVAATSEFNHRVLYTRQTMSSTNNSISKALENRMELCGVADEYTFANNDYTCKQGKGLISITGQKTSVGTQTAKLKSIEDYSVFATDEGEELTDYEDWLKIKRSVRAQDVQCIAAIVFNPPTKRHFLYSQFYMNVPAGFNGIVGRTMYIHTTYLDNGKENMAEHNWHDYEALRMQYELYESLSKEEKEQTPRSSRLFKDWREYKTTILGGFKDVAEGVIFDYTIGEFQESDYGSAYGLDQGWTHPSACIKVHVDKDKKKIWLKEILYKTGQNATAIYNEINNEVKHADLWIDDAAPTLIADLKEFGLEAKGCKKPKIKDSINAILDYEIIIDKDSTNLIDEMDEYRWNNVKTKEVPVDAHNHAIDAFRYAFNRIINTKITEAGTY